MLRKMINSGWQFVGIFVLIGIIVCYVNGWEYEFVLPQFSVRFSSETVAAFCQWALVFLWGAFMRLLGEVYNYEKWSIGIRTGVHLVGSVILFVITYSILGVLSDMQTLVSSCLLFVLIYIVIWTIVYFKIKREIQSVNQRLAK